MTQNLMQGSNKNQNYEHCFKHHETVFSLLYRVTGALPPGERSTEISRVQQWNCSPRLDSQSPAWQGSPASSSEMAPTPAHYPLPPTTMNSSLLGVCPPVTHKLLCSPLRYSKKKAVLCHTITCVLLVPDLGKFCPDLGTRILENASKASSYKTIVISLGAVVSFHVADPQQLLWDVSWCRFVCIGTAQAALAPQPSCLFLCSSFLPNPFLG